MRLIVFDLDGTLVDSRRDLAESANAVLEWAGARPLEEEAVGQIVGEGAAALVARAFEAAGVAEPQDALARFLSVYDGRLLRHTRPYEGVIDALDDLHRRASLALLTNKPISATRQILDGLNLSRFFMPHLVRGGDGPLPRKPDPAGLFTLIAETGATPGDTRMVGDSAIDWRTAHAAGIAACLVRWGFGFHTVPMVELVSGDVVIDRPSQLAALL